MRLRLMIRSPFHTWYPFVRTPQADLECSIPDPRFATAMSAGPTRPTSGPLDDLLALLGGSVDRAIAQRLLSDAGGSLETAVNMHFSSAGPSAAPASTGPAGALQQLRGLLGDGAGSHRRLQRLLEASRGSVEGAIELHFAGRWIGNDRLGFGSHLSFLGQISWARC